MPNNYDELKALSLEDRTQVVQGELTQCWEAYSGYASGLRTWFVAYGAGLLALFITDAAGFTDINLDVKREVAGLFATGAFAQILVSMANKFDNYRWFRYWDH